ncbi:MAG: hypothetical protein A3B25_01640 [Candidatus Ryanbacteria bacterium RIFCSPLOWO2_01_FULL_48_26]|uniref:DUF1573 domain-containing protein n=1 Tax=Candidatus Ryanbacteria bacterium RIFCSPLOWO2_01_FULL_48_26 TaxID=1802126 RepID=A0A1G2GX29_9BACT|nr:MAG: hypothetical protein A3B25_01640 [Candidatus Ryanbacteria bacterium RIFCSPLOWO2_01_FULL_48_26]
MKNIIIVTSIAVFMVGVLLWGKAGRTSPAESAALATGSTAATIADSIPPYDFGSVSMLKGSVEHEFAITNTTAVDLAVTKVETSCMCTRAVLQLPDGKEIGPFGMPGHGFAPTLDAIIRPGENFIVRVIFDPAAHGPAGIGRIERAVTLGTSKGPITMQFSATVTP